MPTLSHTSPLLYYRYTKMTTELGVSCQIVGDDLLVTNPTLSLIHISEPTRPC